MDSDLEIYIIDGPLQGTSYPLPTGVPLVIGRHDVDLLVDIDLQERVISSPHMKLWFDGERLQFQDLESRNGTKAGERTVKGGGPIEVAIGDIIHLAPPRGPRISTRRRSDSETDRLRAEVQRLEEQVKRLQADNEALRTAPRPVEPASPPMSINVERVSRCLDDFHIKFSRLIEHAPESLKPELQSIQGRFRELERLLAIRRSP